MADESKQTAIVDNPKTDDEIKAFVKGHYEDNITARRLFEHQWYLNINFYRGNHWVEWKEKDDRIETLQKSDNQVHLSINRIRSMVNMKKSRLLKSDPMMSVMPSSTDERDFMAAKTGEKLLRFLHRKLDMPDAYDELATWMFVTGTCFLKPYWDGVAGDTIEATDVVPDDTGQMTRVPRIDPKTGEIETFNIGEVAIDVVPAFQLYIDPLATKMKYARWVMQVTARSMDWYRENYPEFADDIKAEISRSESARYERKLMGQINYTGQSNIDMEGYNQDLDTAPLYEVWFKRNSEYPNGRLLVVAGDVVVKDEDNPYEHGEIPFIYFGENTNVGCIWDTSTIEDMIPVQMEYNKIRSQLAENRNKLSNPQWLLPTECNVAEDAITNAPGDIIEYNGSTGLKPEQSTAASIPSYVENQLSYIENEMMDISGLHEVSRGGSPGSIRSGNALAILQEQDDTRLAPVFKMFKKGIEKCGRLMLSLVQQYYDEPRTVSVTGENGRYDVFEFIGSDLRGQTDVYCEMGSAFPQSREAKQAYILQLFQYGLLNNQDPQQVKHMLKLMEFGGIEKLFEDTALDEDRAEHENQAMVRGETIRPQEFEDHTIHSITHKRLLKSPQGYDLQANNPEAWQIISMHQQMTEQLLQQQQQAQMQQQMAMQMQSKQMEGYSGLAKSQAQGMKQQAMNQGQPQ